MNFFFFQALQTSCTLPNTCTDAKLFFSTGQNVGLQGTIFAKCKCLYLSYCKDCFSNTLALYPTF